eukprot:Rmarinus@m.12964
MDPVLACLLGTLLFICTGFIHSGLNTRGWEGSSDAFGAFRRKYLLSFGFMAAGDWIQGAYDYEFYDQNSFSHGEISLLFVSGFLGSLFFGSFMGVVADLVGRKRTCAMYGVVYSIGCLSKRFPGMSSLMVGRVAGGVATGNLSPVV